MKKKDLLLFVVFAAAIVGIQIVLVLTHRFTWHGLLDWHGLAIMCAAASTFMVLSQLYGDNPLFKLAEHILLGAALAYGMIVTWYSMWVPSIIDQFDVVGKYGWAALSHPIDVANQANRAQLLGLWSVIIPIIIGLMIYTRLSKKHGWVSRSPLALLIGFGVGYSLPQGISASLLKQLQPMMIDMLHNADTGAFQIQWDALIIMFGVFATLIYFFFSVEHKGAIGVVSRVGVWFLMIAFGASFGYTVMSRLSILIGRINFLFHDWIPLIP